MLGLICYGLICGAPDVKSIWRKCGPLNESKRLAIGLTQRSKATGKLIMPGYDALNDLINKINPQSMAQAINKWLLEHSDTSPKTLAIDGKDLGGKGQLGAIVTLCHSSTGIPLMMQTYIGGKDDYELPVTTKSLGNAELNLNNTVITNDALTTKKTGFKMVTKGGDYVSALKANQLTLYLEAQSRLDHLEASYVCPVEKSHGRIEHRELRCYSIEEDISSYPQSRQFLSLKRSYTDIKSGKTSEDTRHFITILEEGQRSHKDLARINPSRKS